MGSSERDAVVRVLRERGVSGAEDFGTFVNDTRYLAPSRFDERAAMPVLLELWPTLTDQNVAAAVARHLRRRWARPSVFVPAQQAFMRWAHANPESDAAWATGDTLARAATAANLPELLELSSNADYGMSRQMIVFALYRFKTDETAALLKRLIHDPSVGLHAMSSLRRVIGNESARPLIEAVERHHAGSRLGDSARRELRKIDKKLAM